MISLHPMKLILTLLTNLLLAKFALRAETFYVATDGMDDASRDGREERKAWASLAFASEHLPKGAHTIRVGAGDFIATRAAWLPADVSVIGNGLKGDKATRIVAAPTWKLTADLKKQDPPEEYLIAVRKAENVVVRDLVLASDPGHRITGGLFAAGITRMELANLHVHDFRWSGVHIEHSSDVKLHDCLIERGSMEKHGGHGGLIRTKWLKNSEIHHNRVIAGEGDGFGYKGGGHENVKLHHNLILAPYFAIESAHENEFGVEVHHNHIGGCISIPKGGQAADPKTRGFEFSFWIHDNVMTDSYAIEGPRNHLRLDHNYIRIERPGGRVYTQHGGINHGPVSIHHNVIENVDRSLIYVNEGLAENIEVSNNTVTFADAGERTGNILSAWSGERMSAWVVRDNVFLCPASKTRALFPTQRGVPSKITATNNLCVNVTEVPDGNAKASTSGLRLSGTKPWPFYAPIAPGAATVGAYEAGRANSLHDIPLPP
jgi:Right handed beta helix region